MIVFLLVLLDIFLINIVNITHTTEIYKDIFKISSYHITIVLSKHSKISNIW